MVIGNKGNNISLIGNIGNNNDISFEHLVFKLPPKGCICSNLQQCPVYQMVQKGVFGVSNISPGSAATGVGMSF